MTAKDVIPLSKPFETVMDVLEMDKPLVLSSSKLVGVPALSIVPMPLSIAQLNKHFAHLAKDDKVRICFSQFTARCGLSK